MIESFVAKCRVTGVHHSSGLHPSKEIPAGTIDQVTVVLQPVFGGEDDAANKGWSKWTPSGEVRLTITNPLIFPLLKNGACFMITFTPAEESRELLGLSK